MLSVTNTSLQGFNVPFNTGKTVVEFYIPPKKTIKVPDSYTSIVLDNLLKRKMVRVLKVNN
jgi:hypothetical protein